MFLTPPRRLDNHRRMATGRARANSKKHLSLQGTVDPRVP
jgi:hypothetical protein